MILARGSYRLVDAVAEPHQPALAPLDALDELRHPLQRANLLQHAEHGLVGPAVKRAVEGGRRAGQRRVGIDVRAADAAHRVRAAVLFVIGVEDEQHLERPLEHRIGLVLELRHLEQHVQEVAGEAQRAIRQHQRAAGRVPQPVGGDRRRLGDQPQAVQAACVEVRDVLRIGVEGAERADGAQEHPHRVGVVAEAFERLLDPLRHDHVIADVGDPLFQVRSGRELTEQDQVGRFEVAAVFRQLLDRVPAVHQDSLVAVDERDPAPAGGGVRERRVVGHQAEVVRLQLDLAQIHRTDGAVLDRDVVVLAGAIVGNRQGVGHATYPL